MRIDLLRPKDAAKMLGIGLSTFWVWAKKDPDFPPLVKLSTRCTAVRVSDLQAYVDRKSECGPKDKVATINIKAMDSKDVMRSLRSGGALQRANRGAPDCAKKNANYRKRSINAG